MGTRAVFYAGDPRQKESEYLGAIDWDGYPDGLPELQGCTSAFALKAVMDSYRGGRLKRADFVPPERGFAFPWTDDIFITDYVYAFFDGALRMTNGYSEFVPFTVEGMSDREDEDYEVHRLAPCPADRPYQGIANDSSIVVFTG